MNLLCHIFIWVCRIVLGCVCAAALALAGAILWPILTDQDLWEFVVAFLVVASAVSILVLLLGFFVLCYCTAKERVSQNEKRDQSEN